MEDSMHPDAVEAFYQRSEPKEHPDDSTDAAGYSSRGGKCKGEAAVIYSRLRSNTSFFRPPGGTVTSRRSVA